MSVTAVPDPAFIFKARTRAGSIDGGVFSAISQLKKGGAGGGTFAG
jgi:hypothetical protein